MCEHGDNGSTDARIEATVAHHGSCAEENLGSLLDGMGRSTNKAVADLNAGCGKTAGHLLALEERLGVNNIDAEFPTVCVGAEEGLEDDAALGEGDDHIAIYNLGARRFRDDFVGSCKLLADESVDGGEEMRFCGSLRNRWVNLDYKVL